MRYENWISYRYFIASKGRFLTFLNLISITGVAIGVMALIVVTGVMTGFGNNLREKIIGTTPHIMIEKETGIKNFYEIKERVYKLDDVKATSAYVQGNVFLESSGQALSLVIRGIEPESENQITKVDQYLVKGQLSSLKEGTVFIGSELARYFGFTEGDEITLISPGSGMSGQGWRYKLRVTGIFNTGMADFDMNLIISHISEAQKIFNLDSTTATGIGVRLSHENLAKTVKMKIYQELGFNYIVRTWIDTNRNLFEALFLEKWGLFIILTLMVLVASFNIISTMIVTVTSKIHDIGVLKSIGVTKGSIRSIFTYQGVFIGLIGILWGLIGGLGISYILKTYVQVPEEIYSIDTVPIEIQPFDVTVIVLAAFIISFGATIYPAYKAANLEPVEALRYE